MGTTKLKSIKIETLVNNKRLSTQQLLQIIYKKIDEGYNEFEIDALGQHNIGGPLWTKDGSTLVFHIKNPGQRVGSMAMPHVKIIVEGSAPADVGWLNSGAQIIVKGDGGDTTAHCAAGGKIFIGGQVGTRSGALMKKDPRFDAPQFWVLKNTGSFSFEFMGGGIAVVCGLGCENLESVLGAKPCAGMVGGIIYVRGKVKELPDDVTIKPINEHDKIFLMNGLNEFLNNIDRLEVLQKLLDWDNWSKIEAKSFNERKEKSKISLKDFRKNYWVENSIFEDIYKDDFEVIPLVNNKENRLRVPIWGEYRHQAPCEFYCPLNIPTQKRINLLKKGKLSEAAELVLKYTPFPSSVCGNVCPNLCMENCNRQFIDEAIKIGQLGLLSENTSIEKFISKKNRKEKVAIIGSGPAGLSCAYQLAILEEGYKVEIFEQDKEIGGKLYQVIPQDRLKQKTLKVELERIKNIPNITIHTNKIINESNFEKLLENFDAVVIAVGAHNPIVIPFQGSEKLIKGLEFLKNVKNGKKVDFTNKDIVIIGAGNAAMDVVIEAKKCGANNITAVDIQKPNAFPKEIQRAKSLSGVKIVYPFFTDKITDEGIFAKDGSFIKADVVIISVGDKANLSFLEKEYFDSFSKLDINEFLQLQENKKIFIIGDAIKQGLFVNALKDGFDVAKNIDNLFNGRPLEKIINSVIDKKNIKSEYYHCFNSCEIDKMKIENEKSRCLSCGSCQDCQFCLNACPKGAISRKIDEDGNIFYVSDENKCIGCGICQGVCPCGVWVMEDNLTN